MKKENKEYWILRGGDFRVEKLTEETIKQTIGKYASLNHRSIEILDESNNLFNSEELAVEASLAIRSFLSTFKLALQERQRLASQTQKQQNNTRQPDGSVYSQTNQMETQSHSDEPLKPNVKIFLYPEDNNHSHVSGIHLTIQFHS